LIVDRKTRGGKVIIATTATMAALILMAAAVFIALQPVTVVVGKPATLNIRAAAGYESMVQVFIKSFPDFTATDLHYGNPYMGPSQGPWGTLTIDAEYVSAKAADTSLHVTAQMLDVSVGNPIGGVLQWVYIKCKSLEADVTFRTPDADDGEFGTLVAKLKGDVLFHVPNIPGLPKGLEGGYHYEGQSLTITATFVEPRYDVIVTPSSLEIPQGTMREAEVTVMPREAGITGQVSLGFECKDQPGISAEFGPWTTPPFTTPLKVHVRPGVEAKEYTAYVIVNDWTTGRIYKNAITINVIESGFTVTVEDSNPYTLPTPIPKGTSSPPLTVKVTPWTDYTVGMGLYWRPAPGDDFRDIGIEMPGGIPPPPSEVEIIIKVGTNAIVGKHTAYICVADGGLGREFTCQVTFEVV